LYDIGYLASDPPGFAMKCFSASSVYDRSLSCR
jgi:hypothetical protein